MLRWEKGDIVLNDGEVAYIGRLGASDLSIDMPYYQIYIKITPSGKIIPTGIGLPEAGKISRYHVRVSVHRDEVCIEDWGMDDWKLPKRGSKIGTFVDGEKIDRKCFNLSSFPKITVSLGGVVNFHIIPVDDTEDLPAIILEVSLLLVKIKELCYSQEKLKLMDVLLQYSVIEDHLTLFKHIDVVNEFSNFIKTLKIELAENDILEEKYKNKLIYLSDKIIKKLKQHINL